MTLAPDHLAYTARHETTDPAPKVSVIPNRAWKHLTLPPEDAPALDNLPLARDIILAHLNIGTESGHTWRRIWARIVTDLDDDGAITYEDAQALIADYAHFARINGGTEWDPQDAEDLHNQINRHLRAAGYTEGN